VWRPHRTRASGKAPLSDSPGFEYLFYTTALLAQLKSWMAHNKAVIMALLCLIIGVKLIGDAISGLSA
jgi:hypothetical protein